MKKSLFFLLHATLITIGVLQHPKLNAQNRIVDSLKLVLENSKDDTIKVNTLLEIVKQINLSDPSSALNYCNQAESVGVKIGFKKGIATSYAWDGAMFTAKAEFPKALEYFQKSLKINKQIGDKSQIAVNLNNIGMVYYNLGDVASALGYFQNCLILQKQIGDKKTEATTLNNIGAIYERLGNISKSLECYHMCLKISEKLKDKSGIAMSLNNLGGIYKRQDDIPRALNYYNKSLKILEDIGDKLGIATSLNNIGLIYLEQKNTTMAIEYIQRGLKIKEEIGDKRGMATSLINVGTIYYKVGNPSVLSSKEHSLKAGIPLALEYCHKGLKVFEEIGDNPGVASALEIIAEVLLSENQTNKAFLFANRSLQIGKELGFPKLIKNSASVLKQIYQKQNKYKEAFEMYELEIKMRDSINNQATQKSAVKKQMQYTYEKKAALDSTAHAKENEINNAEILARKAELKVKQNTQYALYGGLTLVLVFAGFMFNRFKVTQKQKHIIEIKEKETQQQKHIIEEKHKEITDSINYAERIQRSFIATKEILDENLSSPNGGGVAGGDGGGYFVFFKPKDIVSGDFYWAAKLSSPIGGGAEGGGGLFALVTADSTGHGVPGAIMSLLNITSLEKAIETLTEPSEILNSTRKTIIERLKKDGSEHGGKDGMDASLCVFDFKNKKLIVAAANNPVWIVRTVTSSSDEGAYREVNHENSSRYVPQGGSGTTRTDRVEVIEIKPDKMPVGKHDKDTVSFTQQTIDLQSGDVVYTLTDGFPDQFGGEKGKKFMSKNLKELLAANSHLPMHEQKQILENTFANWVGDLEQVDDVTLIGVRI